jgi:hypothetical protein
MGSGFNHERFGESSYRANTYTGACCPVAAHTPPHFGLFPGAAAHTAGAFRGNQLRPNGDATSDFWGTHAANQQSQFAVSGSAHNRRWSPHMDLSWEIVGNHHILTADLHRRISRLIIVEAANRDQILIKAHQRRSWSM